MKYDVIVVGSGATGGWAAKELCEAGLNVAMLEAGPRLDPDKDYSEHAVRHELPFRGRGNPKERVKRRPTAPRRYPCLEANARHPQFPGHSRLRFAG